MDDREGALFSTTAGATYRVVVGAQDPNEDSGTLQLQWQLGGFGDRDAFSQAASLAGGFGMFGGSNLAATREPGEPDHCANDGGASVWFTWTAPATGGVRFRIVPGTLQMACLSVYRGNSVSALTHVAGDGWNDPPPANSTLAAFNATAGETYRIVVDGLMCEEGPPVCTQPTKGTFTLAWEPAP
jgi:hypothetical protein